MLTVGIGEYMISDDIKETIITHALGSCVALIVHCPINKQTALAHIVLPQVENRDKSQQFSHKPSYFADMIVPQIVTFFTEINLCKTSQLQVFLVGGADALNKNDVFKVGSRNVKIIKRILKSYEIVSYNSDVGGNVSRTVSVKVNNGHVSIKKRNMIL